MKERFRLKYNDEDIGGNLSLIEKARAEFGTALPGLPEGEDLDVPGYFTLVSEAIKEIPNWSVDSKSIVLGFFSFNKFLMYRDLDANTWPDDAKPSEHEIIGALFARRFRRARSGP